MIRVLVVDDSVVIRRLVSQTLERDPDIRVIEVLSKNIADTKSPSKWVTQVYFPVRSAAEAPKPAPPAARAPEKPAADDAAEFSIQ